MFFAQLPENEPCLDGVLRFKLPTIKPVEWLYQLSAFTSSL